MQKPHEPATAAPAPAALPPPGTRPPGAQTTTRQIVQTWFVASALWLLYCLSYADELLTFPDSKWGPITWSQAMLYGIIGIVLCWVPLTILLVETARHVRITRRTLFSGMVKLALAIVVVLFLRAVYIYLISPPLYELLPLFPAEPEQSFREMIATSARYNLIRVLVILAVCYSWVHLQNTQAARLRIAELESGLTRARLDALAAQLNPHFLFNALNSIAELIHLDPQAADRMLIALSALLRRSLSSPGHEVTVQEEAALVAQYFSIEKIRLGERLDVHWEIDPSCTQALVPALILQPLAENAIVHGIARRRTPGRIDIAIRCADERLVMEVSDDGRASEAAPRRGGHGIGLANTQARLRCLYGNDWSLTLHTGADARSVVRVDLPLRFLHAVNDPDHRSPAQAPAGRQEP